MSDSQEPVPVQEEVQAQEPQAQEPEQAPEPVEQVQEPEQAQEPVEQVQEPEQAQEPVAEAQAQEPVEQVQEPVAPQDPFHPATHEDIESLHLFFSLKHFISERLLVRAMHSLLDVVPNAWEWAANIDVNNINQGVDPTFDAIMQQMNIQMNFKYDVTWETKPVFVWILHQLNYIAKHGISQFKLLYSDFQLTKNIEGLWELENLESGLESALKNLESSLKRGFKLESGELESDLESALKNLESGLKRGLKLESGLEVEPTEAKETEI